MSSERSDGQTENARSENAGVETNRYPRPDAVSDTLFKENPFFDPNDLLQVRYEMLRRHSVEGASIVDVASRFGISRVGKKNAESRVREPIPESTVEAYEGLRQR
jgi:hypothetical protein